MPSERCRRSVALATLLGSPALVVLTVAFLHPLGIPSRPCGIRGIEGWNIANPTRTDGPAPARRGLSGLGGFQLTKATLPAEVQGGRPVHAGGH